jgi:hypothetical protein
MHQSHFDISLKNSCLPLASAIAACFALAAFAPRCFAAYDNVTNCNDTGFGSLRDTIAFAATGDTVVLNPVTMQCSAITLVSGEIVVPQSDLTVKYNGDNSNQFTLAGNNHRVFHHTGTGTLQLRRLGIELGKYTSPANAYSKGGCVYSAGTVDLEYSSVQACKVTGNSTDSYGSRGGGVYAAVGLILNRSTISGNSVTDPQINYQANGGGAAAPLVLAAYSTIRSNSAGGYGGGLSISVGTESSLKQCTISGNTGHRGGGVSTRNASLTILESTISGNTVSNYGSGLFVDGAPVSIYNSTIAFNSGTNTCGIIFNGLINHQYTYTLESSIVANNGCDVGGDVVVGGHHNIISTNYSNTTLPPDTFFGDPLLVPLANNGGPTQTHAFRDGSPAFGAGTNNLGFTTDQRGTGFARAINGAVDIGAYEAQSRDLIFADGFE